MNRLSLFGVRRSDDGAVAVDNDVNVQVLKSIISIMRQVSKSGISDTELQRAKYVSLAWFLSHFLACFFLCSFFLSSLIVIPLLLFLQYFEAVSWWQ